MQRADRHVVVRGEDRRRGVVQREQPARGLVAVGDLEVAAVDELRRGKHAGARERRLVAVRALLRRHPALAPLDDRDPPVAELEEMLGRRPRSGPVRGGDDGDPLGERHRGVDHDEREALALEVAQLLGGLGRENEDRAVGRASEKPLDERRLTVVLVPGGAEHGSHLLLVQRLGRAGEDGGVVVAEDVGDRAADEAGASLREAACAAVRREAHRADDLHHGVPRLLGDVRPVVDDAGDRGHGHPRPARHVADRRPARSRCLAHRACASSFPEPFSERPTLHHAPDGAPDRRNLGVIALTSGANLLNVPGTLRKRRRKPSPRTSMTTTRTHETQRSLTRPTRQAGA